MKNLLFILFGCIFLLGCAFTDKREPFINKFISAQVVHIDSVKTFNPDELFSLNDPVCGMDLRDHIGDTTLINGKLYGFCNPGCKKTFLKKMHKNQVSEKK